MKTQSKMAGVMMVIIMRMGRSSYFNLRRLMVKHTIFKMMVGYGVMVFYTLMVINILLMMMGMH